MNIQDQVTQAAIKEIETPTFAITEQYLQIHDVVLVDGIPQVSRVDMEGDDGVAIVYFPIQGQRFYLAVYLDTHPQINILNVSTENYSKVYLRATCGALTYSEITALTTLKATGVWNSGDCKKNGRGKYTYSGANFEPNPEPDSFEDKLEKLLDYLEQDKQGVAALVDQAASYIQVDVDIHNGNGLIGGPYLSKQNIKRMSEMNLAISFDQYVSY